MQEEDARRSIVRDASGARPGAEAKARAEVKTPAEWRQEAEYGLALAPALTKAIVLKIQIDALLSAALVVHDLSRGTKSKERAAVIDEARDALVAEANRIEFGS